MDTTNDRAGVKTITPGRLLYMTEEYIKSGRWKCPPSPTGAHHWVEQSGVWTCRYCKQTKSGFDDRDKKEVKREEINNIEERQTDLSTKHKPGDIVTMGGVTQIYVKHGNGVRMVEVKE